MLKSFNIINDPSANIAKAFGHKDLSKLQKKEIVNKKGKKQSVWVKNQGEDLKTIHKVGDVVKINKYFPKGKGSFSSGERVVKITKRLKGQELKDWKYEVDSKDKGKELISHNDIVGYKKDLNKQMIKDYENKKTTDKYVKGKKELTEKERVERYKKELASGSSVRHFPFSLSDFGFTKKDAKKVANRYVDDNGQRKYPKKRKHFGENESKSKTKTILDKGIDSDINKSIASKREDTRNMIVKGFDNTYFEKARTKGAMDKVKRKGKGWGERHLKDDDVKMHLENIYHRNDSGADDKNTMESYKELKKHYGQDRAKKIIKEYNKKRDIELNERKKNKTKLDYSDYAKFMDKKHSKNNKKRVNEG